jgi:hypothetical protein
VPACGLESVNRTYKLGLAAALLRRREGATGTGARSGQRWRRAGDPRSTGLALDVDDPESRQRFPRLGERAVARNRHARLHVDRLGLRCVGESLLEDELAGLRELDVDPLHEVDHLPDPLGRLSRQLRLVAEGHEHVLHPDPPPEAPIMVAETTSSHYLFDSIVTVAIWDY